MKKGDLGQNVDFWLQIFGVKEWDFGELIPMGFWCHFGLKNCRFGSENVDFWRIKKQPFWEVNFGLKKGDFGSKCRFLVDFGCAGEPHGGAEHRGRVGLSVWSHLCGGAASGAQ